MTMKQAIGTGLAVLTPALGGQVVSAGVKAASETVRDFAADHPAKEFLVDLAGGAVAAGLVTGVGVAMGGKASKVAVFAGIGAVGGAGIPLLGTMLDAAFADMLDDVFADAPVAKPQMLQQRAAVVRLPAAVKKPGGMANNLGAPALGGNAPGGRYDAEIAGLGMKRNARY